MITVCFLLLGINIFLLVLQVKPMSAEDYEFYFRRNIMGMTVSTMLSPETQQMLAQRMVKDHQEDVDPELDSWHNFFKYIEDSEEED
jgi:glycine cleavage system aminomethyltransferase T